MTLFRFRTILVVVVAVVVRLSLRIEHRIHGDILLNVELAFAAIVVHEADFAKYWALSPRAVVGANNGPHTSDVTASKHSQRHFEDSGGTETRNPKKKKNQKSEVLNHSR